MLAREQVQKEKKEKEKRGAGTEEALTVVLLLVDRLLQVVNSLRDSLDGL